MAGEVYDMQEKNQIRLKSLKSCWECSNKMVQIDMDEQYSEVIGCKKLTQKQWEQGLKDNKQTNCPIIK